MNSKNKVLINLAIIALITIAILVGFYGVAPENRLKLKLGLDLRSGTHIALQLKEVEDPETHQPVKIDEQIRNRSIQVFTKRLNSIGTSEISIAPAGIDRIIIEIPEMTDLEKAKNMVKKAGRLEFKEKAYNPATQTAEYKTVMDGRYISKATVQHAGQGADAWCVSFDLNKKGAKLFGEITTRMVGQPLGIFFDGTMHSEPVVQTPITGGSGQITGHFTIEEANELANILNAGALPVDVDIIEAYTVSPTLGAEALNRSIIASAAGLILVVIYMIIYYRLPGVTAAIALAIYAVWVLGTMVIPGLEFVLTLPGIAGFVLSLGMAVDANVLQFERVKEELRAGKSIRSSLDIGFARAFSSILDGHVATFLGAAILFYFGASSIKGFGITLMIGTALSMVTAIWITRQLLYFVTDFIKLDSSRKLFGE
ncbi:MAG: protein translocase subunit SecD [bacterium]|nr:protein translocase subunit SecD [bacterium]